MSDASIGGLLWRSGEHHPRQSTGEYARPVSPVKRKSATSATVLSYGRLTMDIALPIPAEGRLPGSTPAQAKLAVTTWRIVTAYLSVMTLVWLWLNLTGAEGGVFFKNYRATVQVLVGIVMGFLIFW